MAEFLDSDAFDKHLKIVRRDYKTLVAQYSASLLTHLPDGTRISRPEGGYVLWVQLTSHVDSRTLQQLCLKQKISIGPGPIFSPGHNESINFMRINCAIPWSDYSQKAIQKVSKIIHENFN